MNRVLLLFSYVFCFGLLQAQELPPLPPLPPEQKQSIDAALPAKAPAKPKQPRRILVINLSVRDGNVVRGGAWNVHPASNYALEAMGKRTGAFETVFSNDVEMFRPDKIRQFDAVCFNNTTGVLFEDPELRRSLLEFVAGGKGLIGIHDAIATFVQYPRYDQWPEFGQMLGGTENGGHPWNNELMVMKLDDPDSPINAAFKGRGFEVTDQAFQLQEPSFRDRLHVLFSIDVEKTPPSRRGRFLPVRQQDKDFPMSWIKRHGKGRVFYFGLGHNASIFWNAPLLEHLLAGIQYALGDLEADDRPSAELKKR
ncbi:MAG TPA: ThuA domain-containing protein [Bryobacteraceae bacterium]|nr:ThuA domain-containing protein [Bryobacteraceae bacterium]HPQ15410.1 ThuA domain-containing protein [Bryobacteraceae bacterium]